MNFVPHVRLLLCLCMLPLLAGCAGYRSGSLRHLNPKPVPQHEQILFTAKTFDHCDCHSYLGRDVISAGYTPIHLAIKNNSRSYLDFSISKINLKTVPANMVAESVYFSVLARALGYGIPSIFCFGLLLIPACVDATWAKEANDQILRDYLEKAIQEKTIVPDSNLEGLIFVPNNSYDNNLEVTLIDRDSLEKIVCKTYL